MISRTAAYQSAAVASPSSVLDEGQQPEVRVEAVERADEERVAGWVVYVGEEPMVGGVDVRARVGDAEERGLVSEHEGEAYERPGHEHGHDDRRRPIDAFKQPVQADQRLRYPA